MFKKYSYLLFLLIFVLLSSCQQASQPEDLDQLIDPLEFSDYPEESAVITGELEVLSRSSLSAEDVLTPQEVQTQNLGFVLAEFGQLRVSQLSKDQWHNLTFMQRFKDPIVIMQPLSFNDGQPAHIRLKEVTGEGVVFQLDEWNYLSNPTTGNGRHSAEEFSYLVWEKSALSLPDGLMIEAGVVMADHNWKAVNLSLGFSSQPLVLTQVMSYQQAAAVVTRQRFKSARSFEVRLQEEERSDGVHSNEKIAYLAISRGQHRWGNLVLSAGVTGNRVSQNWYSQSFAQNGLSNEKPIFLASMQSYRGAEPAGIRYKDLSAAGVKLRVEEEKSKDNETLHPAENVGYLLLQRSQTAQVASFNLGLNQQRLATCQSLELRVENLALSQGLGREEVEFHYSFGDDTRETTSAYRLSHSYDRPGSYIVQAEVRLKESQQNLGTQSQQITIVQGGNCTYIALIDENRLRMNRQDVGSIASGIVSSVGGELIHLYQYALTGFAASFDADVIDEVANNEYVSFIGISEYINTSTSQTLPNDAWALDRIDQENRPLDNSYTYQFSGKGVRVFVIDTGIWAHHEEFEGRVQQGFNVVPGEDPYTTTDCHGHGTHVAGIIGGRIYGVAKEVWLYPIKVFPNCADNTSLSNIIAGIDKVLSFHNPNDSIPAIINMSLSASLLERQTNLIEQAVYNALAKGVVVVAAAGNNSPSENACNYAPASTGLGDTITVAGSNSADIIMPISNQGPCVDIIAPGEDVKSAWTGYTTGNNRTYNTISGTSMAAPHVAGVAALYLEANPRATPAEVENAIKVSASRAKIYGVSSDTPNLLLNSNLNFCDVEVSLSPNEVTLTPGQQQEFVATVMCASNTGVTWVFGGNVGGNANRVTITMPETEGDYTLTA
ncbi:MAG: S8 family peptidase [Deinococcales bacterium]